LFCCAPIASAQALVAGGPVAAPSIQRLKLGDFEVTALLDGYFTLDPSWILAPEPIKEVAFRQSHLHYGPLKLQTTAFLLDTGTRRILIDAGTGRAYGATLGQLPESLRLTAASAAQITDIAITHMHPDHIGGLLLDDGSARYPSATLWISKAEIDYWANPEKARHADPEARPFFEVAQAVLRAYDGRLRNPSFGQEIAPGLTALEATGHTAGHMVYLATSRHESLMFLGDLFVFGPAQLADPKIGMRFDGNKTLAAGTRQRMLQRLARESLQVAVAHEPFPGFGYIRGRGRGFEFIPSVWPYGH
jgi:glyoxylase-like metal-dependent hydrolase (beta-lactamase superfamily II)